MPKYDLESGLRAKHPELMKSHGEAQRDQIKRQFAFDPPRAMYTTGSVKKSSTGLWSAEYEHPSGKKEVRGYLSKAHAKAAGSEHMLNKYGRVPLYVHEDD